MEKCIIEQEYTKINRIKIQHIERYLLLVLTR